MTEFFVVLRDDDTRLHRHYSRDDAETEAKRLARAIEGHGFHVLRVVATAKREVPVILRRHDQQPDDDLPF